MDKKENRSIIDVFQKAYPTREAKVQALRSMTDEEIEQLIQASTNVQAKIFYKRRGDDPDI